MLSIPLELCPSETRREIQVMKEKANNVKMHQPRPWLHIHMGKSFDQYFFKDGLEKEPDALLEHSVHPSKATDHE